ncbi:glutamyl aminopeptidase-like [Pseudomyrmex gracilis]|uniref:glutamyl aminopeptidase-like n=1 Tax=Pseudomyrmex gracilis TaxID=219809 RepID=UPI0009959055|nr:glutamyl aminopeptidase-like [Pseudomyrmex gracilis]
MTIYPFLDKTKIKKYLILPRIPAEWIFPYWENPATKATFTIQINHDYIDETVLSHMPGDRIFERNKFYTSYYTSFPSTSVMSTQLVAIAVLPYESVILVLSTISVKSRLQVINDTTYARSRVNDITKFIRNKWKDIIGTPYVQYVILPVNSSYYETVVTTGLVFFKDADIAYNKEIDSFRRKTEVTCLVARSVIQEAFSNWLITLKQSDSWFIEGFFTFYGVYVVDQIYSETLLMSIVVQTRRMVFDYTQAFIEYDLPLQKNRLLHNVTFSKMWREKIFTIFYMINSLFRNPDVLYNFIFDNAIKLYNTSTSSETYNLQSILENVWSDLMFVPAIIENIRLKNEDIKNVITTWIEQTGYPLVQVNRDNDTQSLEIIVQDCVAVKQKDLCAYKWWIPVTYVPIAKNVSITNHYKYIEPNGISNFVPYIKEDDFIIITGHNGYRVNYDRKSWENIALFLKSKKSKTSEAYKLSDVSLAQILDDAFYFLIQNTKYNVYAAKRNNIDIFFNLASNVVRRKNSYIVWHSIFTTLQYISKIFPLPKRSKIKTKVVKLLNIFLKNILHKNVSENTVSNQVYHEVLKWTCILGGLRCKEHINAILQWHLENPVQYRLLPNWQNWMYCQGLMLKLITDKMLWHKIQDIYLSQEKHQHFFHLFSCSGLNQSVESFGFALKHNLLKESDSVTIFFDIIARHVEDCCLPNSIISKTQDKYSSMYASFERNISILAVMSFRINHIYSDEGLEKVTLCEHNRLLVL